MWKRILFKANPFWLGLIALHTLCQNPHKATTTVPSQADYMASWLYQYHDHDQEWTLSSSSFILATMPTCVPSMLLLSFPTKESPPRERSVGSENIIVMIIIDTCRSNPWPNECLPRMKCTPQQCRTHSWSYHGTFSVPRRGSNLGPLGWHYHWHRCHHHHQHHHHHH